MTHSPSTPANPVQVTGAWLVTNGPDGQCAKVVVGFENLKHEVVAAVFGDGNDASEEAQDMRDRLDTPGDWEGDRWSMTWSFEDGYLNVQRISDLSVLTAVNPAQVTDAMVAGFRSELSMQGYGDGDIRRALTAAIGAGGQVVAEPISYGVFSKHGDLSGFGPTAADAELSVDGGLWDGDYIAPLYTHPAPSGQAGMEDWQRIDDALVSCAGLLRTLCKDEIGDTAAAELEYVRSALSNPPAQPGWRMVPEEPTDAMIEAADHVDWGNEDERATAINVWHSMLTAAHLPGGAK